MEINTDASGEATGEATATQLHSPVIVLRNLPPDLLESRVLFKENYQRGVLRNELR